MSCWSGGERKFSIVRWADEGELDSGCREFTKKMSIWWNALKRARKECIGHVGIRRLYGDVGRLISNDRRTSTQNGRREDRVNRL